MISLWQMTGFILNIDRFGSVKPGNLSRFLIKDAETAPLHLVHPLRMIAVGRSCTRRGALRFATIHNNSVLFIGLSNYDTKCACSGWFDYQ